ncbi:MerR family transcriptional regulator [Microbacterium sp. 16-032]|uniref:MerR family transcriptional regulator n=1 Tax=Microbacterium sp. 16-032 TaxID=3239808 RepID=UPI0034E2EDE7
MIAGSSPEPPAPIGEDVIDATVAVRAAVAYFAAGLSEVSNDLVAMEWLGPLVLDRHPADEEGVRERWSIQDAADRWGAERGDVHRFPAGVRPNAPAGSFARADDEEAHAPVREWYDPLLTVKQAAKRVGVTEQAVRLWVSKGLLVPATKARGPRGSVLSYFYASKVDAVDTSLEEKRTRPKPSAAAAAEHDKESA